MPTIGVAVAIPEPYGTELRDARLRFGDPLATAIPTHVTLLPPTEVAADEADAIDKHLRQVAEAERPFRMLLRGTGTFRPVSPVVFVQIAVGLVECERVAADVRGGPLAVRRLDFPYHPHVTVAHDTPPAAMDRVFDELADYEAVFDVHGFDLYRHGTDGVWRTVRTYPFGSDPRAPGGLRTVLAGDGRGD